MICFTDRYVLRGEPQWMIITRGILAMLFILGVIVFALFSIVLNPVSETGLMPLKVIRSQSAPEYILTQPAVWNIVVVSHLLKFVLMLTVAYVCLSCANLTPQDPTGI